MPGCLVRSCVRPQGGETLWYRPTCRGADIVGRRVPVVEDVVTSGGQIAISTAAPRAMGARIEHAVGVIDRGEGGAAESAAEGITLRTLFSRQNLTRT